MTLKPKETLHQLEGAPAGQRFQRLYRQRQRSRHAKGMNIAFNVGGMVAIGVGIATYPVPVIPSEIVILAGLVLVSQGSMRGARFLDGAELRLRRWFAPAIERWHRLPTWLQRTLGGVWVVAVSALGYWAYRALHD
jgi:hypothetical protein